MTENPKTLRRLLRTMPLKEAAHHLSISPRTLHRRLLADPALAHARAHYLASPLRKRHEAERNKRSRNAYKLQHPELTKPKR